MFSLRLAALAALMVAATATKKCPASWCTSRVRVTVYNLAPKQATLLTPVWVGFHDGTFDLYDRDVSLDGFSGMESLVEDGDTAGVTMRFASEQPGGQDATLPGLAGPLDSGEKVTMEFDVDPVYQRYFSFASMVIPSNDAFIANGNPLMFEVFSDKGKFTPVDVTVAGAMVLDGGVEVNDEIPKNTAGLAQMAPNTGEDENGVVTSHPGFLQGGNVLAARPNADFLASGSQVARIRVERVGDSCVSPKTCQLVYKKGCAYTECKKKVTKKPKKKIKKKLGKEKRRRRRRRRRRNY